MKNFITKNKNIIWSTIFWLLLFEVISKTLDNFLFVSPFKVIIRLFTLLADSNYYLSVFNSYSFILIGYFASVFLGLLLAFLSYKSKLIKELLEMPLLVISATPVASFIILVLVFISSRYLNIVIGFLMCLPIVYRSTLNSLKSIDNDLKELVYFNKPTLKKRLKYLYIPKLYPSFFESISLSLSVSVKAGIAAEVIGVPLNTIGEKIFLSKIFLEMTDLFAYTFTIILITYLIQLFLKKCLMSLYEVIVNA